MNRSIPISGKLTWTWSDGKRLTAVFETLPDPILGSWPEAEPNAQEAIRQTVKTTVPVMVLWSGQMEMSIPAAA